VLYSKLAYTCFREKRSDTPAGTKYAVGSITGAEVPEENKYANPRRPHTAEFAGMRYWRIWAVRSGFRMGLLPFGSGCIGGIYFIVYAVASNDAMPSNA
jgi:hypothetical protein